MRDGPFLRRTLALPRPMGNRRLRIILPLVLVGPWGKLYNQCPPPSRTLPFQNGRQNAGNIDEVRLFSFRSSTVRV